jgi:hypothetical protein
MKKRFYVFKGDGATYAFSSDRLSKPLLTGQVDANGEQESLLLDTEAKVLEYLPGGQWHEVEILDEILGKHDVKVRILLTKPPTSCRGEYEALNSAMRSKFLDDIKNTRMDAVVASVMIQSWTLPANKDQMLENPATVVAKLDISEDTIEDLPRDIKTVVAQICDGRYFDMDRADFFQNAFHKQGNSSTE